MKFLVSNYSCLQNPWLGGYRPSDPRSLCPLSATEFVEFPPPQQNSCVCHWENEQVAIKYPAIIIHLLFTLFSDPPERRPCRRECCHRPKYPMQTAKIRITIKDSRKSTNMMGVFFFLRIIFVRWEGWLQITLKEFEGVRYFGLVETYAWPYQLKLTQILH